MLSLLFKSLHIYMHFYNFHSPYNSTQALFKRHKLTRVGPGLKLRRCLHDTRSSFIPVRLHPGSILSIYICLHDTNQNCIPERVIPERLHPGSRTGSKFSFQNEICLHVPPVSCKGGTGSFRYGKKQVDWLG